jgi:hypothetical protein
MDSCHSLQCESQIKRIFIEGELDSGTAPLAPGKNPRPTYERLENYEVFEERKTKWTTNPETIESSPGNKMKSCGKTHRRKNEK